MAFYQSYTSCGIHCSSQLLSLCYARFAVAMVCSLSHSGLLPSNTVEEHSQQQAADLHTSRILIDLLSRTQPPGGGALTVLKQVCQLLDMMLKKRKLLIPVIRVAKDNTGTGPEGYSNATSYVLLQLSLENEKDPEIYTYLASTAIEWLQLERVRLHFAEANNAMLLLSVLGTSYKRYSIAMKSISTWNDHSLSKYGSVEPRLRSAVIKTLAEVSTVPQFILHHTLESKFVETLQEWLLKGLPQLQACACVVLANMANSDVNRIFMLHHFRVHEILLPLLESSKPANLRASAAYFLKALLVSEACQQFLSNRPIVRIASCLWGTTDSPHLQYIGITLTKQAVEGSYNMLRQLLEPLSSDPDSPAHNKTFLSLLLRLWQDYYGYRQHERLTSEVAWTVVTVCSMLGSLSPLESPPDAEELQNRLLLNHPEVANPLIALLTEENQPVARSKALFVMALLAQKPLGLRIVGSMIDATEVSNLMSSLISRTGLRNTAEQGQMRSTCDHRNALILMSCLQKNKVSIHITTRADCANDFEDSLDSRDKIEFLMKTLPDFDAESISGEIPTDTDDG